MFNYKVTMVDDYLGNVFTFSIDVKSKYLDRKCAEIAAREEFPNADVLKVDFLFREYGMENL